MKSVLLVLFLGIAPLGEAGVSTFLEQKEDPDPRTAVERQMTFSNSQNSYRIRFRSFNIDVKRPWLNCALDCYNTDKCGFGVFVEWLTIKVNGILYNRIVPKEDDIRPYAAGNRKGFDIAMNFDGAHAVLRLYMRDNSPCLWGEFLPQDFGSDRVREAELRITACPSFVDPKGKQKGCCRFGGYKRRIFTASRALGADGACKNTPLGSEDEWFVFADDDYDGGGEGKGKGPCFATVDFSGAAQVTATVSDSWTSFITCTLKPESKRLAFGIWESPGTRVSNEALRKRVAADRNAYLTGERRK